MLEIKGYEIDKEKVQTHINFLLMDNRDDTQSNKSQAQENSSIIPAPSHQNQAIVEISIGSNNSN